MGEVSQPIFTSFPLEADDSVDQIHVKVATHQSRQTIVLHFPGQHLPCWVKDGTFSCGQHAEDGVPESLVVE